MKLTTFIAIWIAVIAIFQVIIDTNAAKYHPPSSFSLQQNRRKHSTAHNIVDGVMYPAVDGALNDGTIDLMPSDDVFYAAKHRRKRRARMLAAACESNPNKCGDKGTCVTNVGCVCFQDSTKGFWAVGSDGLCSQCSNGYAGSSCTIECQGGSCNQCSGNGVCVSGTTGDGTCTCNKNRVGGFWAGSSCSVCASGYFGSKCVEFCPGVDTGSPCANRGTCVKTGGCVCQTGYGSDSGCVNCDEAHYSVGCALVCPGYATSGVACSGHGKCFNGTSGNGTCLCDAFWGLEDCSKKCPNSCSGHGVCSDGAEGTATCTCDPRYAPPDCLECIANRTGPSCEIACPVNANKEVCNLHGSCEYNCTAFDGSANCSASVVTYSAYCTCAAGYAGETCEIACPGTPPCSGHGACVLDRNATGYVIGKHCECFQSSTNGHWDGTLCDVCSVAYNNSANCTTKCPATSAGVCNNRGTCAAGFCYCVRRDPDLGLDYCGEFCNISSLPPTSDTGSCTGCGCYYCTDSFMFGQTCQSTCPGTSNGITCSGHGSCSEGKVYPGTCECDLGYAGTDCSAACPVSSVNNLPCSGFSRGSCICSSSTTAVCNPICQCRDGFAGSTCELVCPIVNGATCSGHGSCDPVTALCVCGISYTGPSCSVPCGCNTANGFCNATACYSNPASDVCFKCVCNGNFTGTCSLCKAGTQGLTCGGACVHGTTSTTTKDCICQPNWSTDSCTVACPVGSNGLICSGNGTCASGNRFSGLCACNESLYGATCDTFCTVAYCRARYGMVNPQCNDVTGACECQNNVAGYWEGATCSKCKYGYWGTSCTDACDCSDHGSCDAVSCYCSSDAVNGYFTGSTCSKCQTGYIGASCNIQDVAITRLDRTIKGLSGSFLVQANYSVTSPSLHSPVATVAEVDEVDNTNVLYVGGRSVARFNNTGEDLIYMGATTNPSVFSSTSCNAASLPDAAHAFVHSQYVIFLMQPMNMHDDGCNLPLRLVVVLRQNFQWVLTQFLNVTNNGTVEVTFNNTVRAIAATHQADVGDSADSITPRLAFLVAETYLDSTTTYLAPYPNGWVVFVAVDKVLSGSVTSTSIVSRRLGATFVANDIAFSPYVSNEPSVMAIAGFTESSWDVLAMYLSSSNVIVNAYSNSTSSASVRLATPCWVTLSSSLDVTPCSFCTSAERVLWVNNDIVFAASTSLSTTDTVIIWLRRVQDMQDGSTVLQPSLTSICVAQTLKTTSSGTFLTTNASSIPVSACSSTSVCPEALFQMQITQTGTPTSQATAIALDSVTSIVYVALRVNAGNSASVLAKCSVTSSKFAVYGLRTLLYVTNSVGKSKPEVVLSLAVAKKARMMFAAVSGVQVLSIISILLYEVQTIAPDIADQRNSTHINITGSGFVQVLNSGTSASTYRQPMCVFGSTTTRATIVSSTLITCVVPTESETASAQSCGLQTLEVTLYEDHFITYNQVNIQRAQSAVLSSVTPVRGSLTSPTPQVINITGTGFQNSTFSRCKFFSDNPKSTEVLYSPVTLITPNLVQCSQPNATEASYDNALLDLSIDGQMYTIDGPISYEIVGEAAGIINEPSSITVAADEKTQFSFTTFVVDQRRHKLVNLDAASRTVLLLLNVTYNSSCESTVWRPDENCIPNFFLVNSRYPNATSDGSSRYPDVACYNATLNGVATVNTPWTMTANDSDAGIPFDIGYDSNSSRVMSGNTKAFALFMPSHVGQVTFSNLFFYTPRTSSVLLTVLLPDKGWTAQTTITIVPGAVFAVAINNIADFEAYSTQGNQSSSCSTSLSTKFTISQNTALSPIEVVMVDRMANIVEIAENQFLVTAKTYYVSDYDGTRVDASGSPPAPTQQNSKFVFSEITLPFVHGASHFVRFLASNQSSSSGVVFTTTSPPIRTKSCGSNQYKVPLTAKCDACPGTGMTCDGSELITVLPGYWRANGSTTHAYLCPGGSTICLGSLAATNLSYCKPGHTGPLCSTCLPGYGKSSNDCVKCQDTSASAAIVAVVLLLVFVVLVIWTIVTLRNATTTDISVIMRTIVNHLQATGELGAFATHYGPFLKSFMSGQGQAGGSVSVNGVQAFDCLIRGAGQNYYATFAGYMCLPAVALVLAIVVFGVVRALKLEPVITPELLAEVDRDIENFGSNARTAILKERYPMFMVVVTTNCVIMFTLYQNIITQCANALQCSSYVFADPVDGATVTKSFLQVDMTIPCEGGTSPLTTPALIFAALYGLGIPLAFTAGYLFVNDTVNMPELTKLMFLFLSGGYKDQFFFWQNLIMIRKLLLVLLIVFLKDDQEMLNYCVMWVMTLSLVLQVWLQPAEKDEHNFVESVSLAVIVLTLNLGLLYFWELSDFANGALTFALILITFGILIFFVVYGGRALRTELEEVYVLLLELRETVKNFGKSPEKKRPKLRAMLSSVDDDLPPLHVRPHISSYHRAHTTLPDDHSEADFDEYTDEDEPSTPRRELALNAERFEEEYHRNDDL